MKILLDIKYAKELNTDDIIIVLTPRYRVNNITIENVVQYSIFTKCVIMPSGKIHLVNLTNCKIQENKWCIETNQNILDPYQYFFTLNNAHPFYKLQFLVECHEFIKAKYGTAV